MRRGVQRVPEVVMGSKHLRTDLNYAWPSAEIAVMGAEEAVNILSRRDDPAARQTKIDDYNQRFATPFVAAENGFIDAVIEPRQTRLKLIRGLRMLENKKDSLPRKKHGNIPL